jgi:hypothetical protein
MIYVAGTLLLIGMGVMSVALGSPARREWMWWLGIVITIVGALLLGSTLR